MERMPALGPFAYASLVAGTAYLVDALGGPRGLLVPAAAAYLLGAIVHRPAVWRGLLNSGGRLGLAARGAAWMSIALSTVRGIGVGTVIGAVASRLLGAPPEGPVMALVALGAVVLLPSLALRRAQREGARLGAGVRGEEDVAAVLGELPARVGVIHSLRAGSAEVDHLVLYPRAGPIVIETKDRIGSSLPIDSDCTALAIRGSPHDEAVLAAMSVDRACNACILETVRYHPIYLVLAPPADGIPPRTRPSPPKSPARESVKARAMSQLSFEVFQNIERGKS
jgi:hypothetical protein